MRSRKGNILPSLPTIEPDVERRAERAGDHGAFDAPALLADDPPLFDYLCRLGDDSLILGQRLSEWCGHAPALEVDLSLANLALDASFGQVQYKMMSRSRGMAS